MNQKMCDLKGLRARLADAIDKEDWETVFSISKTIDEMQCSLWSK